MTPQDIIRSSHAMLHHLQSQRTAADQAVRDWEMSIDDRDLIEKRRVAPGYLDTGIRFLEPTRSVATPDARNAEVDSVLAQSLKEAGDELDRVFCKMAM